MAILTGTFAKPFANNFQCCFGCGMIDLRDMTNSADNLQRRDDAQFQDELEKLIRVAEDRRLHFMRRVRGRQFMAMTISIIGVIAGAGGFGWFLFMKGELARAVGCMLLAIFPPLYLHFWASGPIRTYGADYKRNFMPEMARVLGGFKFHIKGGINSKLTGRTGVLPPHDSSTSEDCFTGIYKGIKVIISEARLYKRSNKETPVFQGIFVLLETTADLIEGHTIITSDNDMIRQWAATRWKKLQVVDVKTENTEWNSFRAFSDTPQAVSLLVNERLLKELSEASKIFDGAPVTAVLFAKKFIFMMIPCKQDMFEASDIFAPVTTTQHALKCKKEVERILEIIDVFDLYSPARADAAINAAMSPARAGSAPAE